MLSELIKLFKMKTESTQREILLVTNNSFSQRQWCIREDSTDKDLTSQEQMEEVCANGLIYEILPEIFKSPGTRSFIYGKCARGFLSCS
jgi:hypothetical protein